MKKFVLIIVMLFTLLINQSCRKDLANREHNIDNVAISQTSSMIPGNSGNTNKIYVSDVAGLYAAVNNPLHTGTEIILAPGKYVLVPGDSLGGRLKLQKNMSLRGLPGNPDSVVIDASGLPPGSFPAPPNRTGSMTLGNGDNSNGLQIK